MEGKTKVSHPRICPKLIIFKCTIMLSNGSWKMCFLSLSILPLKDVCLCSTNFGAWRAVHLVVSFSLLSPSKFRAQLWMNSLTHCNLIFLMCNVRLVVSPAAQSSWYHSRAKAHALLCVVPDTQHSIKYVLIFIGLYLLYNFVFFLLYGKVNQLYVYICVVVQSPSCVQLFATPWIAADQASLFLTTSWSLPKFTFIALVMLSSHLVF